MKESIYKTYDDLPLFLNATLVAQVLGISAASSYKTIGQAVGMSTNTVQKYIAALAEKGFISIESTSIITKSSLKRNGSNRYTIHPIQEVVELYRSRQLRRLEESMARSRLQAETTV